MYSRGPYHLHFSKSINLLYHVLSINNQNKSLYTLQQEDKQNVSIGVTIDTNKIFEKNL